MTKTTETFTVVNTDTNETIGTVEAPNYPAAIMAADALATKRGAACFYYTNANGLLVGWVGREPVGEMHWA
jgi:hypothetical protein